jgi:hypothetical protein
MSDSAKTNWTELNEQVADLQVKAFLRVLFEIGEVLNKQADHGAIVTQESTGKVENLVTNVTDRDRSGQILFCERGDPNQPGAKSTRGKFQDDENQIGSRQSNFRTMAKAEDAGAAREEPREAY